MQDNLGDRMKNYESITQTTLPRRSYTIIRLDGKAFHSFTKGFDRPYSEVLATAMDETAQRLCKEVQGVALAYVQSDEISLVVADLRTLNSQSWYDGNVQKIVSVSASIATAAFNNHFFYDGNDGKFAFFDSRVFTVPSIGEAANYLIWRQKDATRNSISMAAHHEFGHKALQGKSTSEKLAMLQKLGKSGDYYPAGFRRGRVVWKRARMTTDNELGHVIRTHWSIEQAPDWDYNLALADLTERIEGTP